MASDDVTDMDSMSLKVTELLKEVQLDYYPPTAKIVDDVVSSIKHVINKIPEHFQENFTLSRKNSDETPQSANLAMFLATAHDTVSEAWTRSLPTAAMRAEKIGGLCNQQRKFVDQTHFVGRIRFLQMGDFPDMFKVWSDFLGGDAIGLTWDKANPKKRGRDLMDEDYQGLVDALKAIGEAGKVFVRSVYFLKNPKLRH